MYIMLKSAVHIARSLSLSSYTLARLFLKLSRMQSMPANGGSTTITFQSLRSCLVFSDKPHPDRSYSLVSVSVNAKARAE